MLLVGNNVVIRTAPSPEGPWTSDVTVYTVKANSNKFAYAGAAYPFLDTSGKTLVISYTNYPNVIEVIKVEFSN